MKMLPALGKDSTITENGLFMVRPVGDKYEIVNTVTDQIASHADPVTGEQILWRYSLKDVAEMIAISLAQIANDLG